MANLTVNTKKYGQITLNTKSREDPPLASQPIPWPIIIDTIVVTFEHM